VGSADPTRGPADAADALGVPANSAPAEVVHAEAADDAGPQDEELPAEAAALATGTRTPTEDDQQPLDVPRAEDVPRVDPAIQLQQQLVRFAQPQPAAVRDLLAQLSEMAVVPVDLSAVDVPAWRDRLDQQITLELESPTLLDLLQTITARAKLQVVVDAEQIRIVPPDVLAP
jgi:hypothetical protein